MFSLTFLQYFFLSKCWSSFKIISCDFFKNNFRDFSVIFSFLGKFLRYCFSTCYMDSIWIFFKISAGIWKIKNFLRISAKDFFRIIQRFSLKILWKSLQEFLKNWLRNSFRDSCRNFYKVYFWGYPCDSPGEEEESPEFFFRSSFRNCTNTYWRIFWISEGTP